MIRIFFVCALALITAAVISCTDTQTDTQHPSARLEVVKTFDKDVIFIGTSGASYCYYWLTDDNKILYTEHTKSGWGVTFSSYPTLIPNKIFEEAERLKEHDFSNSYVRIKNNDEAVSVDSVEQKKYNRLDY